MLVQFDIILLEMEGREADCRLLNGEFELEFLKGMESSSPRGLLDQIFEDRDGIGTSNSPDISVANNEDQGKIQA